MYTLNNIVKIQEDFAMSHGQINDFVFDQAYSYEVKPELKYPLLWTDLEESPLGESENSAVWSDGFVFNVAVIDLVRENKSNEQDVLSDCKLMLNDFIIYLRQTDFGERLKVEVTVSMKPIRMSGENLTSGWQCQLKFGIITDPDLCGIPME